MGEELISWEIFWEKIVVGGAKITLWDSIVHDCEMR
jgi:hypothetical protein